MKNVTPPAPAPDVPDHTSERPAATEVDGTTLRKLLSEVSEDFANRALDDFNKTRAEVHSDLAAVRDKPMRFQLESATGEIYTGRMTVGELYDILDESCKDKKEKQRQEHGKSQFADCTTLDAFSDPPFIGMHYAVTVGPRGWERPTDDFPYYEYKNVIVSLDGKPGGEPITPAHAQRLQEVLETIADRKTAYLYIACMHAWNRAYVSGKLRDDLSVRIHVNELCEVFGYAKHPKGGYYLTHKKEIAERLQQLDMLKAHGTCVDRQNRRRVFSGSYADVLFLGMPGFFGDEPYEFFVRPGIGMMEMVIDNDPTMEICTSLAQLFSKRGRSAEYAIGVGLYLSHIFRFRYTKPDEYKNGIAVKRILERAGIGQGVQSRHYTRLNESVEAAFDLLRKIEVVADWQYADEDAEPTHGWFAKWLERKVIFTLTPRVLEDGKRFLAVQQSSIKTAKRRRKAAK